MINKIRYISLILGLIMLTSLVIANVDLEHDFTMAINILEEKNPLNQLNDSELEMIGDYFMELMVGERHEAMDSMMGGEGSVSLSQFHTDIALNNYDEFISSGRLGSMMGSGMMGGNYNTPSLSNQDAYSGMMSGGFGTMMGPGTGHSFYGFGFLGFFTMIIFWAFVIWAVFLLVKQAQTKNDNPKDIAKTRYAKGEISKKEYESMIKELKT